MAYYVIKIAKIDCLEVVKEYTFRCPYVPEPITIYILTKGIILEAIQKEKIIFDVDFEYVNGQWSMN